MSSFKNTTERDVLISNALALIIDNMLINCKRHVKSCNEAFSTLKYDPLLSEETAKSLLALIIHRPFLYENQKSFIPDIESLLSINKSI